MDKGTFVLSKEEFMERVYIHQRQKKERIRRFEAEKKSYIMDKIIGAAVYRRKRKR